MDDPLGDSVQDRLCVALYQASHAMTAAYRSALRPLDLSYPQYTVMSALWQRDPCTVKELAAVLRLDYNTISPLVKRLEMRQLVTRVRDETDERVVLIGLTPAGRRLADDAAGIQAELREATGLTEAEQESLVGDLHALADRLRTRRD